jgi:hypothetical protein
VPYKRGHRAAVVRRAIAVCCLTTTVVASASAQTLPSGWRQSDTDSPALAGSGTFNSGTFSVTGAGSDISGSSDQFTFVLRRVSGDTTLIARVASLQSLNFQKGKPGNSQRRFGQPEGKPSFRYKAGIMFREWLSANSKHASVVATLINGIAFRSRTSTGGTTAATWGGAGGLPVWPKLARRSNRLTVCRSATANGTGPA